MLVWGTFDHCTHLGLHFTPTDAACVGFKQWPGLQSWPRGQARLQALSESVEQFMSSIYVGSIKTFCVIFKV